MVFQSDYQANFNNSLYDVMPPSSGTHKVNFWHGTSSTQYALHSSCGNTVVMQITTKIDVALVPFRKVLHQFVFFNVMPRN